MEEIYGPDFFFQQSSNPESTTITLMTKSLRQKLEAQLKEAGETGFLIIESLEETGGEKLTIQKGPVNLFTRRKVDLSKLADQLIDGETLRVKVDFLKMGEEPWLPVVVNHDFVNQAPLELGWIMYDQSQFIPTTDQHKQAIAPDIDQFYKLAKEYLSKNSGITYLLGGKTKQAGFDCSGLVQLFIYKLCNLWLPRLSRWQALAGDSVKPDQIQPMDVIYFDNSQAGKVTHIGLVYQVHPGKLPIIIHCSERDNGVVIEDLNDSKWLMSGLKVGGFRRMW